MVKYLVIWQDKYSMPYQPNNVKEKTFRNKLTAQNFAKQKRNQGYSASVNTIWG